MRDLNYAASFKWQKFSGNVSEMVSLGIGNRIELNDNANWIRGPRIMRWPIPPFLLRIGQQGRGNLTTLFISDNKISQGARGKADKGAKNSFQHLTSGICLLEIACYVAK